MDSFATTIGNLFLAHARVKAIDRDALTQAQKEQRSRLMTQLRNAATILTSTEFASLSADAKASAEELDAGAQKLADDLKQIQDALKVLDLVSSAIGSLASLVKLVA